MNDKQSLPRVLGPWMASAIVVGTVIGTGVFKKGNKVAGYVPEFGLAISVWVVVGILTLFGALTLAEVAVRFPKVGGNYVFLREGYGRMAGFLWGWVDFGIIRSSSIAVLAIMVINSLSDILTHQFGNGQTAVLGFWGKQLSTCALIVGLTLINSRGTQNGGRLQVFLTLLKVGSILGLIVLPFIVLVAFSGTTPQPSTATMSPTWPDNWGNVNWSNYGAAMVAVLWAYHGWMNIGPVAEEVRNPQRNIPIALVGGVLVLIGLYVGAQVAYYTAVPANEMATLGGTPVATEFCKRYLGPAGIIIASLILMTSACGSLNGNILVAPRLLFAMSDDKLAPKGLREVHPRYQTPARAMFVFAAWSCFLVMAVGTLKQYPIPQWDLGFMVLNMNIPVDKDPFDVLTDFCVFGATAMETFAVAAIFMFRIRERGNPMALPYRCVGYPIVPAIYVLCIFAVLANMFMNKEQRPEAMVGLGYIAVGALMYWVCLKKQGPTRVE